MIDPLYWHECHINIDGYASQRHLANAIMPPLTAQHGQN